MELEMPSVQQALIDNLEHVIAEKDIGDRAAILRRVTDLFVAGSGKLSDEQVALFDDVMGRLLEEVEISARAAFGHTLATVPDAPPRLVRMLALDDVIDVAGPFLAHSEQIDEPTLVEGAKTKSQAHMLAISRRKTLPETVTDILVIRGDRQVVMSTAGNHGAAFSEFGYSTLVQRSSSDDGLATCVWSRPEIPRQHLLKLFAEASESVKHKLMSEDPRKAGTILEIVAQASHQIQTRAREKSASYADAYAELQSLHASGKLNEAQLAEFARAGKFDAATIALSFLCELPIALVERAFVEERSEQIIVIAKAFGFSWETVKAILLLQDTVKNDSNRKLEQYFETFTRLKVDTAKKAIQFYRLRERAMAPKLH
jgi:uncharacterized protein (DUF2336 family)